MVGRKRTPINVNTEILFEVLQIIILTYNSGLSLYILRTHTHTHTYTHSPPLSSTTQVTLCPTLVTACRTCTERLPWHRDIHSRQSDRSTAQKGKFTLPVTVRFHEATI